MTPDEIQKDHEAGTLDDLKERVNAFRLFCISLYRVH